MATQAPPKTIAGAIWEGDAKWEVTSARGITPCSLKQLCLSYIAENLGSLCNITPQDSSTRCVREKGEDKRNGGGGGTRWRIETASNVSNEDQCGDQKLYDLTHPNNYTTFVSNTSAVSSNSSEGDDSSLFSDSLTKNTSSEHLIQYDVFNVPNYGKLYDKSNSVDPPGDDKVRCDVFHRDFYHFEFRNPHTYLPPYTASQLIQELDRCGMINDSVLSLFNNDRIVLHEVIIHRCGKLLNSSGLEFLSHSNLRRLELHNLDIKLSLLSSCLNDWTKRNLVSLSLVGHSPLRGQVAHRTPLVYELPSLQELDLSYNNILDDRTLSQLLPRLPSLWKLNISHCGRVTTIESLELVADQLLHVSLAGVMIESTTKTVRVLIALKRLRYLDVSTISIEATHEECINGVLVDPTFAPNLEYLDVSNQTEVTSKVMHMFLAAHPSIQCVAMINVPHCGLLDTAKWKHVKFLREGLDPETNPSEEGADSVNECLVHYRLHPHLLVRVLKKAEKVTAAASPATTALQAQLVVNILRCLECHTQHQEIQVLGSTCLHNLTSGVFANLHPTLMRSVVHATIHTMTRHPNNHLLQKSGLLLLCCDSVLHHVSFNHFWVASMALHALRNYPDDSVDLMAVGIASILAAKLSYEQTSMLGSNPTFMSKLVSLVRGRIYTNTEDITLQFTLSALWNLTDESPVTCDIFLDQDGLQLFIELLATFPENAAVETKVLGLFNNVAEVAELRRDLIKPPFISMLRRQLQSSHIAVSYFAGGISAHLLCADAAAWAVSDDLPYDDLQRELGKAVDGWQSPIEEMVAYKSFFPFMQLLSAYDKPHVQLWAMWALHHVTANNSTYYCPMLVSENIPETLQRIYCSSLVSGTTSLRLLADKLLQLVEKHNATAAAANTTTSH